MAGLSSMTIRRGGLLSSSPTFASAGQLEHERRSTAQPVTGSRQRASQLLRRQRAAVQAKAVPALTSGETVAKQPLHVLRGNADAVIDDTDSHGARIGLHPDDHGLVGAP